MADITQHVPIFDLIIGTYKTVIGSDHPEAEQFSADLLKAYARAVRVKRKAGLEAKAKGKVASVVVKK